MDSGLRGTSVLVTGASGGIGQAICRAFAEEGARVAIHYRSQREVAEQLAADLGTEHIPVQADLTDETDVDRMFTATLAAFGRLDAVVANAGIWIADEVPLHHMTLAQWQKTFATDLTSIFLTCRGYLRHVAAAPRETASIVMVGSTAGLFGEENHADYASSKAALSGLTMTLKNEIVRVAPRGRVNLVCPGWVATPMSASALEDPQVVARATATIPLRKVALPEDVASAVVYLTSDRLAGHLSGTILPIAGGMEGRLLHG
ncbi:MAG TPA: SDR family NAD(P)-dependent oxidoreductase [Thermoanaerobaculia bacterium]|nr:SDR family NAD(P)-dependent oxidoreductase [Thermoanaerobaculia bacterium]